MPTEVEQSHMRLALNGATMGTRYAAVFYGTQVPEGLEAALLAAVTEVDQQMSTWKADSDLMRFNRAGIGDWVVLPDRLLFVVEAGLSIGQITNGAFDLGVFDLVSAWGFNQHDGRPDAAVINSLGQVARQPTHDVVELDRAGGRMRKLAPVALDLSGIAKGYGVDRLAETMEAFGVSDYIVSIDGEVRARGHKVDGSPWHVALEAPVVGRREIAGILELDNAAVATSGNYRHIARLDGKAYSHTMDPRIGRPLDNAIQAVTVRASTCMEADGWATALMVLGESGLPLARAHGMEALIAAADGDPNPTPRQKRPL